MMVIIRSREIPLSTTRIECLSSKQRSFMTGELSVSKVHAVNLTLMMALESLLRFKS